MTNKASLLMPELEIMRWIMLGDTTPPNQLIDTLRAENERLTQLITQYEAIPVEDMEEELARLREALEKIVESVDPLARMIARAALQSKGGPTDDEMLRSMLPKGE